MRIALYQPDIPQNTGAMMRLCACMNVGLDIIEPCGFVLDDRKIRRSGMDYINYLDKVHHSSWDAFQENKPKNARLVLMTTKAAQPFNEFTFEADDILIAGRESAGVPDEVHEQVDHRIFIPMKNGTRSLNVVNATSMILGEALRQTNGF